MYPKCSVQVLSLVRTYSQADPTSLCDFLWQHLQKLENTDTAILIAAKA